MSAQQSVNVGNLPGLFAGLAGRVQQLDCTRPLRAVALYLESQAKRSFASQAAPDGTPWAGWKRVPDQARGGPASKLLRDTDVLMASMTGQGPDHVEDVTSVALIWGTAVPYGKYHQYGTAHVPARPFIGFTPQMGVRLEQILVDWIRRVLAPQGGAP